MSYNNFNLAIEITMALLHHFLLLLLLLPNIIAESEDPSGQFCNTNTKINSTSRVSANIDRLLPQLVSGAILNGFIATSYGNGEDQVYGLAQCRGDVSSKDCSTCIQDAAKEIRKRCPNEADARIWYEYCFLRYNTKDFFGQVDTSFGIFYYNVQNVTDPDPKTFNKELGALMDKISSQAVEPTNKGLGKEKTKLTPFITLYALVQCTRDLSKLSCAQCLAIAVGNIPTFCDNKKGCRVLYSSCYLRYELYPFYFPLDSQNTLTDASKVYHVSVVSKP
ncbi:cysteine-rich repeat secretory protein 55 [Cornus florida]|uniref:cysteine-rich repeat secretory protein 55 n=1 Tax=Cornus florida TaxID=4283 RepID=UPI00289E048F|nr:cysteine-rich repeat secretory protein 55 [Cornus florida]